MKLSAVCMLAFWPELLMKLAAVFLKDYWTCINLAPGHVAGRGDIRKVSWPCTRQWVKHSGAPNFVR